MSDFPDLLGDPSIDFEDCVWAIEKNPMPIKNVAAQEDERVFIIAQNLDYCWFVSTDIQTH